MQCALPFFVAKICKNVVQKRCFLRGVVVQCKYIYKELSQDNRNNVKFIDSAAAVSKAMTVRFH